MGGSGIGFFGFALGFFLLLIKATSIIMIITIIMTITTAHRLKGAAANLSMTPLAEVAKDIEYRARDRDLKAVAEEMERLRKESDRLSHFTDELQW